MVKDGEDEHGLQTKLETFRLNISRSEVGGRFGPS